MVDQPDKTEVQTEEISPVSTSDPDQTHPNTPTFYEESDIYFSFNNISNY